MRSVSYKPALAFLTALFLLPLGTVGCQDSPVDASGDAVAAQGQEQAASKGQDEDNDHNGIQSPFDDAEVFFEFNTTDNDLGLQIFLDAEGWKKVKVSDPSRHMIVQIMAEGNLSELGITELRFESAEPSPAEVLALFPPGEYKFRGKTVEGDRLMSTAELSHDFLPAPTFSPSDGEEVDPDNTVVEWDAPDAEQVEVIIENEETGDVFDVIVSGSITSLNVPPQFLEPDTEYKIEILAIAENGNRTIAESDFVTMP